MIQGYHRLWVIYYPSNERGVFGKAISSQVLTSHSMCASSASARRDVRVVQMDDDRHRGTSPAPTEFTAFSQIHIYAEAGTQVLCGSGYGQYGFYIKAFSSTVFINIRLFDRNISKLSYVYCIFGK